MSSNWQTWAALGVVAVTIVGFIVRAVRRHRASKTGCANAADCGCGASKLGGARLGTFRPGGEHK